VAGAADGDGTRRSVAAAPGREPTAQRPHRRAQHGRYTSQWHPIRNQRRRVHWRRPERRRPRQRHIRQPHRCRREPRPDRRHPQRGRRRSGWQGRRPAQRPEHQLHPGPPRPPARRALPARRGRPGRRRAGAAPQTSRVDRLGCTTRTAAAGPAGPAPWQTCSRASAGC
jgi:hypothetical protein